MDAEELATFLLEEVPHLWEYHSVKGELKLTGDAAKEWTDALACAVGLLRVAADDLDWSLDFVPANMDRTTQAGAARLRECKKRLATLRLVVGKKETPDA